MLHDQRVSRPKWLHRALIAVIGLPFGAVHAYEIGDRVNCSGNIGIIIRTDPRPGWDEPFRVVEVKGSATTYEFKCVDSELKPAPVAASQPAPSNAAPMRPGRVLQRAAPKPGQAALPAASQGSNLCQIGAKIEAQWGISWYEVTVRANPDEQGDCLVSFDGYGRDWDSRISADQLRARGGSGGVTRPVNPIADQDNASAAAGGDVPDGSYRCHKISGSQLIDIGAMEVDDGEAELPGMPDGWVITNLSVRGTNSRGELVVALDYRTASGNSDRMDCIPD